MTDRELITEVCDDLARAAMRLDQSELDMSSEAKAYRDKETAIRRLLESNRQSGMEKKHEAWVLATLNWLVALDVPMTGEVPDMLKAVKAKLEEAWSQAASARRQVKALTEQVMRYEVFEKEDVPISSIESDLISAGEDIGKDYQAETHAKLWPAITNAINAIKVARKQRDDLRSEIDKEKNDG